jgi:hypothetical protein
VYNLNYTLTTLGAHSEKKKLKTSGLENAGTSTSQKPMDLRGLLQGLLYLYLSTSLFSLIVVSISKCEELKKPS